MRLMKIGRVKISKVCYLDMKTEYSIGRLKGKRKGKRIGIGYRLYIVAVIMS